MAARKRTERRRLENAARKLVREREKLARLEIGGAPDRPMEVVSSSVIPVRARAQPCPQCQGALKILDERAESAELRAVDTECQRCHVRRVLWFRIVPPRLN
jgi:hypothetical protein